ncbi:MAG: hypothetical protein BWY73_00661 [candidate division TA06 bacterium ADurb.Bin417]|uniref:Glycoside hydrolase family 42 N-terminal domain-containing protein n=1 Tax=candidate division TA06 bacterium ADurb.Bin417 TaxID=1852828 RepID=A0A1V5MHL9_UNCT6|nr:MAG: hypothetical protein BWY73_00661 [candidate division TA06 bacterium ADurb.Bin417]
MLEERTGNWPVAAGRTGERPVDLNRGRTGAFRLLVDGEATTPAGRVQLPLQEYTFSVLRRPPERMAGTFGAYTTIAPEPMEIMGRAGIRRTVTLSSSNDLLQTWSAIEPEPGRFVWIDRRVQQALANGVAITANLHIGSGGAEVPKWARDPADPADAISATGSRMSQEKPFTFSKRAWERFIEAVVGHYKDTIQDWLIMDEPYYVFKAEEYAELLKTAYQAAKRANPKCRVLAHGGYYAPWLPALEKAGAVPYFDAISDYARDPEQGHRLRDFARKHGKTVFNVEYGGHASGYRSIETPEDTNDRRIPVYQANAQSVVAGALRAMGWSASEGFRRYDARFPGGDFTQLDRWMSLFEYDGGLKPAAVAYAAAGRLLDGFRGVGALKLHNRLETFLYEKEDRFLLAFWTRDGDLFQTRFILPPEVRGFEFMGNPLEAGVPLTLSGSPNYLTGPNSRREETLNLLRNLLVREVISLEAETRLDEVSGEYRLRVTIANLDPGRPIQNGILTLSGSGSVYGEATLMKEFWDRVLTLPEVKPGGRVTLQPALNAYRDEIRTARPATLKLFFQGASRSWDIPDVFKAGAPAAAP